MMNEVTDSEIQSLFTKEWDHREYEELFEDELEHYNTLEDNYGIACI